MICKYCGARYTGNKCSSCGKVIPLVKRSTNLDILMSGATPPNDAPVKTFEQGLKEGYQKGLKEGYNNGYAEGKESAVPVRRPAAKNFRTILIFASIVIALTSLSGLLFNRIGYNNGYSQGLTKGKEEGIQAATALLQPQPDEKHNQEKEAENEPEKQENNQSEDDAVKAENVTTNENAAFPEDNTTPTPQPNPDLDGQYRSDSKPEEADGKQINSEPGQIEESQPEAGTVKAENETVTLSEENIPDLDFPYSKEKNGGTKNTVVEKIQKRLNELGYTNNKKKKLKEDGDFGQNTKEAVESFQKAKNKQGKATGVVDRETYKLLFPEEKIPDEDDSEEQEISDIESENREQEKDDSPTPTETSDGEGNPAVTSPPFVWPQHTPGYTKTMPTPVPVEIHSSGDG